MTQQDHKMKKIRLLDNKEIKLNENGI